MGGKCPHRKVKKRRYSHKTSRRSKFLLKGVDAVYDELQKPEDQKKPLPLDEDLPGMGQFYCLHCDRYFASVNVRNEHFKTKRHKKRLKEMTTAPHTQLDAELAAGMGMPDNGPKLMSMTKKKVHPCSNFPGDAKAFVYDNYSETSTERQVVSYEEDLPGRQMIIGRVGTQSSRPAS